MSASVLRTCGGGGGGERENMGLQRPTHTWSVNVNWLAVCLSALFLIKVCCACPGLIAFWGTSVCDWAAHLRADRATAILLICFMILGPLQPIGVILSILTNTLVSASFLYSQKNILFAEVCGFLSQTEISPIPRDLWASEWIFLSVRDPDGRFLKVV